MPPTPEGQEKRVELFVRYCSVCHVWADSESFDDDMHCPEDHRMERIVCIPRSEVEALVKRVEAMTRRELGPDWRESGRANDERVSITASELFGLAQAVEPLAKHGER